MPGRWSAKQLIRKVFSFYTFFSFWFSVLAIAMADLTRLQKQFSTWQITTTDSSKKSYAIATMKTTTTTTTTLTALTTTNHLHYKKGKCIFSAVKLIELGYFLCILTFILCKGQQRSVNTLTSCQYWVLLSA